MKVKKRQEVEISFSVPVFNEFQVTYLEKCIFPMLGNYLKDCMDDVLQIDSATDLKIIMEDERFLC